MNTDRQKVICIAGHRFITDKQGGVELQTWYMGRALAEAGWKVCYLSPASGAKEEGEVRMDMHIMRYPMYSFEFQAPAGTVEAMLDGMRVDIIYQRGIGQLRGIISRYAHRRAIPYVFGLSTDRDLDTWYSIKMHINAVIPIWKKAALAPYALWLDRERIRLFRTADYIIAQHEEQKRLVDEKYHLKAHILRTIHPEVAGPIKKQGEKLILWVSNYRPWKQGELFVRLARRLKPLNCLFIMVYGKTKDEYIGPVIKEAQGLQNFELRGIMTAADVEALMEKSCLFVNTSMPEEGFPNTFVQSWLRETPTVSLNVDPGSVISRKKIGMVSGSFEKLVEDVAYLLENNSERIKMGSRARVYAEEVHGYEHNSRRIAEFFNKAVCTRKNDNFPLH